MYLEWGKFVGSTNFMQFVGSILLTAGIRGGLPLPPPADHIFSELSTLTRRLGCPCTAQPIDCLGYASPFATTRWWSRKGKSGSSDRFPLLGSKIMVDGDCSLEIRWHLPLGRTALTNLDSALKSKDITLSTKVHIVKAAVFPVVMYGCESWTIKKVEHQIIDAFKLWCWRIFLRVPWTARRSNQSIVKEVNPEYSLEGLMLKLKLQYVGHLVRIANLLEKTLMLGKMEGKGEEGDRRWDGWMAMDMSLTKLWEMVKDWDAWYAAVHWAAKIWTWFGDWTTARLVK